MKDRISRSLEYDRERRNDRLWQKTLKTMTVRREIVRNTKGMQKRLGHSIGYGKKRMALSQNTYVYMETMEIAQNKEEKSDKNGNP